jgi:hypothetical protein
MTRPDMSLTYGRAAALPFAIVLLGVATGAAPVAQPTGVPAGFRRIFDGRTTKGSMRGPVHVLKGGGFAADVKNAIPATHAGAPGSGFDVGLRIVREIERPTGVDARDPGARRR